MNQQGMTLVEVLVAAVLISLGLVAVAATFPVATSGVETGRQESTAAFLAEQQVEKLRTNAIANFAGVASTTEAYGSIAGGQNYRRVTTVTVLTASLKQIQVSVFYAPVIASGVSSTEKEVRIVTYIASRS